MNYSYDSVGRLIGAQTTNLSLPNTWQLQFAYDQYGNRLSETPTGGTAVMPSNQVLIDPITNHISSAGYTYDSAGNMTSDGLFNYVFNAAGQMTAVSAIGNTTHLADFSYDATGLRVLKNNTVYIYSGKKVIAEYTKGAPAGAPNVEYIYHGGARILTLRTNATTYHLSDHISDRVDTDSSANVVRTYGSFPFGETWYETGNADSWKFTSYENDAESGLNYAGKRFQSPRLGRFMGVDRFAGSSLNPQSLNRYAYVGNDPINFTDSSGAVCDQGCDDDWWDDGGFSGGDGTGDPGSGDDAGQSQCTGNCVFTNFSWPPDPDLDISGLGLDDSSAIDGLVNSQLPSSDPVLDISLDDSPSLSNSFSDLSALTPGVTTEQAGTSNSGLNALQNGLTLVGFIPGIGDVANGINAVISLARGNYADAALFALSAIPVVGVIGEGAIAAREVETGVKLAEEAEEATTLFRAVNPSELADIEATNAFRNPPGIENKYFSTTFDGAESYASQAQAAFKDGPYSLVETSIPSRAITPDMMVTVDRGIETVTVPTESLNLLSPPKIRIRR